MATPVITSMEDLVNTPIPLNNGDLAALPAIHIGGSVADCFKWPLGAAPAAAAGATAAPVRPFLSAATTVNTVKAHAAVLAVKLEAAAEVQADRPQCISMAIGIAMTRAFAIQNWGLTSAMIENGQAYTPDYVIADNGDINPVQGANADTVANYRARLVDIRALDFALQDYVSLARLTMAVPPLVGLTLIQTGHHYLTEDRAAFTVALQQRFGKRDFAILSCTDAQMSDAVFHKALHPVSGPWSMALAVDLDVTKRLRHIDFSSASVRLPALPPFLRALSAYKETASLVGGLAPAFAMNIGDAAARLDHLLKVSVRTMIVLMTSQDRVVSMMHLQDYVDSSMEPFADGISFCAGFLASFHDAEGERANKPTVLDAMSIKKLRSTIGWMRGVAHYNMVSRFNRQQAKEGKFQPESVFGAPRPHSLSVGTGQYGAMSNPPAATVDASIEARINAARQAVGDVAAPVAMPAAPQGNA